MTWPKPNHIGGEIANSDAPHKKRAPVLSSCRPLYDPLGLVIPAKQNSWSRLCLEWSTGEMCRLLCDAIHSHRPLCQRVNYHSKPQ